MPTGERSHGVEGEEPGDLMFSRVVLRGGEGVRQTELCIYSGDTT